MNPEAQQLIAALQLAPLPREGGYFRQTWRSATGSAIVFLLAGDDFSALHRLRLDEMWHFYAGDPVEHVQLDPNGGGLRTTRLGPDPLGGDASQLMVEAGMWQGARLAVGQVSDLPSASSDMPGQVRDLPYRGWALMGCTLTPPWDDDAFELGGREALLRDFPAHAAIVRALTR